MKCLLKVYVCSARQSFEMRKSLWKMLAIECGLKMRLLNASEALREAQGSRGKPREAQGSPRKPREAVNMQTLFSCSIL